MTGGGGFSGVGKGSLYGEFDFAGPMAGSTQDSGGDPVNQTGTDKTLLDRERNPRDFGIGDQGPVFQADSNPHLLY